MADRISDPEKWAPEGITVLSSASSAFEGATTRWKAYGSPSFSQAVTPTSTEEVAEIVKAATASGIPFLAQGGRHGYGTTMSKLKDGLAIDLSGLRSVAIDETLGTVTMGGGATIRDVLTPVAEAGYQIGSGACNGAGFTGTTLGAGIGYLQGTFGLVVDALVSADFVTAKGELVEVSETSNSDLFWALRGAGANFGIITSATYKLSKQVNGGRVFHAEQDRMPSQLGYSSALFWDPSTQSTSILATFIYAGTEEAARYDLKPFFDLSPVVAVVESIPFQRVPDVALNGVTEASCHTSDGLHSIRTVNVRRWPAATLISVSEQFDSYLKLHEQARTANSAIIIETFSTAAATSIPDESTAYPWRDAAGYIMLQMRWPGLDNPFGETADEFARGLRNQLAATSGYPGLSAYVNYAWGDETLEEIYREDKLRRLVVLKKQWDPDNVFGYSNGIAAE